MPWKSEVEIIDQIATKVTEKGEVQLNKYAHNIFGMRKSTNSSTKPPSVLSRTSSETPESEEFKLLEHRTNNIFKKRSTALTTITSDS
jgi:hypothetical protein